MKDDKAVVRPAEVIVAFFGGMFSPCTFGRGDIATVYAADAAVAATRWEGTRVRWASAPGTTGTRADNAIAAVVARVAAAHSQGYVDAGQTLRDTDATWPSTLPCRPSETAALGCRPDSRIPFARQPRWATSSLLGAVRRASLGLPVPSAILERHRPVDRRHGARSKAAALSDAGVLSVSAPSHG
jgi:hypothetical protein